MVSASSVRGSAPSLGAEPFRDYCRKLAAGVAVVTSCGPTGWSGTTVSTVTSVSMDPPLLMCCVRPCSQTLAAIRAAGRFAVHLLTDDQAGLADRFSRSAGEGSRFAGIEGQVQLVDGSPVIAGALAVGWCDLYSVDEVGDHVVVYGRLTNMRAGQGRPLVWHERSYRHLEVAPPDGVNGRGGGS
ncbi:flavin reductase family protein [Microbispora bryophytorum]|uniref:flavin reductase family protein n=1 Tax=Microbispora bryophytorum TaxID=1460882 RepID=UPI0033DC6192